MTKQYTVPCSKECLCDIRSFVAEQLQQTEASDNEKAQVILAIDEACSNAIIHGNQCDSSRCLEVIVDAQQKAIDVEIRDIGNYTPNAIPLEPIDVVQKMRQRERGGLGLFLIYKIMDKVNYTHKGSIGVCTLSKKFK